MQDRAPIPGAAASGRSLRESDVSSPKIAFSSGSRGGLPLTDGQLAQKRSVRSNRRWAFISVTARKGGSMMRRSNMWVMALLCAAGFASALAVAAPPTVTVFASGFNNPRGIKFGPDGHLYVAEAGAGGSNSTIGQCDQVPAAGPYTGSPTGSRVARVDHFGNVTTVADGFPSSQTSPAIGNLVSGVADIAFIRGTLYALETGAGCSHGVPHTVNGVYRINHDGTHTLIADLSDYYKTHPVAHPNPGDFEPDGTPYSMVASKGRLFVIEPNHGELDEVSTDGHIRRIVDISASQGHIVPTVVALEDGSFYVGNLNTFPIVDGSSKILRITRAGQLSVAQTGFTTVLGVAFDDRGRLYVLENTTGNPFPTPLTGRVVRISEDGKREVIASGLFLPTALTFGPDGNLYVSNVGFGPPPVGMGEILKIQLRDED
jgi:hypothetical protein